VSAAFVAFSASVLAAEWVQEDDELTIDGVHLHARVGAWYWTETDCKFRNWLHSKVDTNTPYPYDHIFSHWNNGDPGTSCWSQVVLTEFGAPTGDYVRAEIYGGGTWPNCIW